MNHEIKNDSIILNNAIELYDLKEYSQSDKTLNGLDYYSLSKENKSRYLLYSLSLKEKKTNSIKEIKKLTLDAYDICIKDSLQNTVSFDDICYRLAKSYYNLKAKDSAMYYLIAGVNNFTENTQDYNYKRYYNLLGVLYYEKQEYHSAYDFVSRAIYYYEKNEYNKVNNFVLHYNKCKLAQKLGYSSVAENEMKFILDNKELLPRYINPELFSQFEFYLGSSWHNFQQKKFFESLSDIENAIKIIDDTPKASKVEHAKALYQKGLILYNLDSLDCSKKFYQKAKYLFKYIVDVNNYESNAIINSSYIGLAQISIKKKEWENAHNYLDSINLNFTRFTVQDSLSKDHRIFQLDQEIEILTTKADVAFNIYLHDQKKEYLEEASNYYLRAEESIDILRQVSYQFADKAAILKKYHQFYEKALNCFYQLYEIDPENELTKKIIFKLVENNHSAILKDHKQSLELKSDSTKKIEQELLQKKSDILKADISDSIKEDSIKILNIRLRLLNSKYLETANDSNNEELFIALKSSLALRRSTYISYFMGSDYLYVILVNKNNFLVDRIELNEDNKEIILKTYEALHVKRSRHIAFTGKKEAKKLYQLLIEPYKEYFRTTDQILLTSGGLLSYIPFDLLIDRNNKYLIESYQICNTLSAKEWLRSIEKDREIDMENVLAMAPFTSLKFNDQQFFRNSSKLSELPHTIKEIRPICQTPILNRDATKEYFINNVSDYPIIHLATHARINTNKPEYSHILFYPEPHRESRLFAHEIASMDLPNTHIISLSACQTGDGQWREGEGIVSLARAFIYAGASNTLMSMWIADDEATAFIFQKFYHYINMGYGKAKALRKAKLDFMAESKFKSISDNPFYWAHIQLIGNNGPPREDHKVILLIVFVSFCISCVVLCIHKLQKGK